MGEEEGTAVDRGTGTKGEETPGSGGGRMGAPGGSASAHESARSVGSGAHGEGGDERDGRRGQGAAMEGGGQGGDSWSCELESGAFHRQAFSLQVDAGELGFQATNTPRIDRSVSGLAWWNLRRCSRTGVLDKLVAWCRVSRPVERLPSSAEFPELLALVKTMLLGRFFL